MLLWKRLQFVPDESRIQTFLKIIFKKCKKMVWCIYTQCVREFYYYQRKKERKEGGRGKERKGKGDERRKEGRNYHPWVINMTK